MANWQLKLGQLSQLIVSPLGPISTSSTYILEPFSYDV